MFSPLNSSHEKGDIQVYIFFVAPFKKKEQHKYYKLKFILKEYNFQKYFLEGFLIRGWIQIT